MLAKSAMAVVRALETSPAAPGLPARAARRRCRSVCMPPGAVPPIIAGILPIDLGFVVGENGEEERREGQRVRPKWGVKPAEDIRWGSRSVGGPFN